MPVRSTESNKRGGHSTKAVLAVRIKGPDSSRRAFEELARCSTSRLKVRGRFHTARVDEVIILSGTQNAVSRRLDEENERRF